MFLRYSSLDPVQKVVKQILKKFLNYVEKKMTKTASLVDKRYLQSEQLPFFQIRGLKTTVISNYAYQANCLRIYLREHIGILTC